MKPAITADQRVQLLRQARAGYPLIIAADKAGVSLATVRKAGARLQAEIAEAEEYAEAHLTAKLLEKGLGGDMASLRLAVERRDQASGRGGGGDLATALSALSEVDMTRLAERLTPAVRERIVKALDGLDGGPLTLEIVRFGDPEHGPWHRHEAEVLPFHRAPALEADEEGDAA